MNNQDNLQLVIHNAEERCVELIAAHNEINIAAEQNYAIQALFNNNYLMNVARNNPQSLENSLLNASAIGISLNPALKHAYLVPRSRQVVLDISYMGLLHLAQSAGAIEFGQCKLVYEADRYMNRGVDIAPLHEYNAFGDRGALVGAYCVVRTPSGAYLTEEMSAAQIHAVRQRSESFKKNSGPWVTDYEEMCRKTVVKRAFKYWPKAERLAEAIKVLNEESGEGIVEASPAEQHEMKKQQALADLLAIQNIDLLRSESQSLVEKDRMLFAEIRGQITAHANQLKQAEVSYDIPL